ncbi:hypothetical protein D9V84_00415 [Bacteroidetes/Chlorobi group bacterium Naka2016]|jgi:hypothetical protein|nr:MAG: hypothetical protein D9V84_00415 [Bacteroidetes/Chlorobi group bacterium Naka2016]
MDMWFIIALFQGQLVTLIAILIVKIPRHNSIQLIIVEVILFSLNYAGDGIKLLLWMVVILTKLGKLKDF